MSSASGRSSRATPARQPELRRPLHRPKASEASHAGGSKAANKALLAVGGDEEGDA